MKIYFTALALVLNILHIAAQDVVITTSSSNEPVENVAIYNHNKLKSTITNENGLVSLSVFDTSDTLYFQHPSFERLSLPYNEAISKSVIKLKRKLLIIPEVITISKYRETQRDLSLMSDIISASKLELLPSQTSADLLSTTGNIFVQKSQGGGGSPVLRGFEANKILLVVDGVRMNNAIYRGGHLQNSITIDNTILESVEIVYGPNAIIYGSDALGGVIHYITRDPELTRDGNKMNASASAYGQISTANSGMKSHLDFNLGTRKFGSLTSITKSYFGDIRMGGHRSPLLENYGKCPYYVQRIENADSLVKNPDEKIQKKTGYSQIDILQKFRFRPNERLDFIANLQFSTSSNIDRYDMLNDTANGKLQYADWHYGPQDRLFSSLKSTFKYSNLFFDQITAIVGYQNIEESRIERKFGKDNELDQIEKLNILTINFDFLKEITNNSRLIYGFETNHNVVSSNAFARNIVTQAQSKILTRYPDGGSKTTSYSAYTSYRIKLAEKLITSIGFSYNYAELNSEYSDFVAALPFKSFKLKNSNFTGSLGLVYHSSKSSKINLLLSTGYRTPNLDDVAKIRPKGDKITVPNPLVKPEYSYNAEIGLSKTFDGYIQINGNYFVTYLKDVIVSVPYTWPNGSKTMGYDGKNLNTYANDNSNKGLIHGFSLNMLSDLNTNISFKGTLNYTSGRDLSLNQPLGHIPPIFGQVDVTYHSKNFIHDFYFVHCGWKKFEDMALASEDNEDEATSYGFPSWNTFNFKTSYKINKAIFLQLAVENFTDNFYKPFASGVAAPGINFILTLRIKV